jgi:LEA14-like dessication related protein
VEYCERQLPRTANGSIALLQGIFGMQHAGSGTFHAVDKRTMKKTFVMFAMTALAGCASIGAGAFQQPIVNFKDLQVEGIGTKGGTVDVILSVYNPNGYRLDATKLTYRLLVDTASVGEGVYNTTFTVQSGDSSIVRLPVNLSYEGLAAAATQLKEKGSVNYRVIGDVTVTTPVGSFTKPYDQTGRFSTLSGLKH